LRRWRFRLWVVASTSFVLYGLSKAGEEATVAADVPAATTSRVAAPAVTTPATSATSATSSTAAVAPSSGPPLLKAKRVYWESLKPTMCVRDAPTAADDLTVVECRSPHAFEVMARTVLSGPKKWPGDAAMDEPATTKCKPIFASYVGIQFDDSQLDLSYLTADTTGWNQGDHTLICVVLDPNNDHLTRALHGTRQ
jgi:hypothetical protein